ncbi:hypothetical protein QR680_017124 [Steinernema hermaphroditum]|uniref:Uncharacterized protein n=1 Tax=Steinernema hermaphroditum TaxID=289476 RepID=A0AA39HFL1_9BILA|nr:hypothetical protein QR680_017124 [Steinernema hermaphroditum]
MSESSPAHLTGCQSIWKRPSETSETDGDPRTGGGGERVVWNSTTELQGPGAERRFRAALMRKRYGSRLKDSE